MAIDDADQSRSEHFSDTDTEESASDERPPPEPTRGSRVRVGNYTWADFMTEFGHGDDVDVLYPHGVDGPDDQLDLDANESTVPEGRDWERVAFDPTDYLGYHPDELEDLITDVFAGNAKYLEEIFLDYVDPETTPVVKDVYTWEHYKWEFYYEEGQRPRDGDGDVERFDEADALGFDPDDIERKLHEGGAAAMDLDEIVDERTVDVQEDLDEDEFFSTDEGNTTVANRYDLEKAVPLRKKEHFREVERYWVNEPYAFVVIFHSEKENEKKYYVIEPHQNEIEAELKEFLSGKLRTAIKYSDEEIKGQVTEEGRRETIEEETRRLLNRYDLFEERSGSTDAGLLETLRSLLNDEDADEEESAGELEGIEVRPEPAVLAEDSDTLNEYQVEKLLYRLKRDFIGYERIDGIKHDINVEDISCDGYHSPVFVYHSEYEQIISNVRHGEDELDDFVVKLAQRSGKGISKRLPQVDATLPDGSRAQLTLGREVSDHGTNYTIRQFKDVPFTPIDLVNWNTFSLDQMAFLWLAIENHKSLIFAGGTASGKTTSLNAVSLFIPSNSKIVSIEDTREVELPQRNWIASVTRPSFSDDSQGDIDEFQLLEAALRQRPDYIVMGEVRGEEGRDLFQVMSTGHTSYSTFHADSVDEVLKRFTTDPINVSKTMFTALDLVSIQTQTRVQGRKVRRNKGLTEINHYEAENDEINVQDVYQWQAETDEYLKMGDSNTLDEIMFDRGWTHEKLEDELFKRRVILAYLIENELNTYAHVAATVQAFINDPDTILTLIANGQLEDSLEDLREMESVLIDVDPEKEDLVPRPEPESETYNLAMDILERAEESLFEEYRGKVPSGLASALGDVEEADPIEVDRGDADKFDFEGSVDDDTDDDEWDLGDSSAEFTFGTDEGIDGGPSWLDDEGGFEIDDDADGDGATADTASGETGASARNPTDADGTPERVDAPELEAAGESTTGDGPAEPDAGPSPEGATADVDRPAIEGADATPIDVPELEGAVEPESAAADAAAVPDRPDAVDRDADESSDTDPETADDSAVADGTSDGSEPAGAPEEAEAKVEGLFDDVGSAIEDDGGVSDASPARDGPVDAAGFDEMFPDRDLPSIFGDEPSGFEDEDNPFESATEEPARDDGTDGCGGADGDESESAGEPAGENAVESDTEAAANSRTDDATGAASEGENEFEGENESEGGAESDDGASVFGDETGSIFGDSDSDGGSIFETGDDSSGTDGTDGEESGSDDGSIFGDETDGAPFESGDEDENDAGSIFDEGAEDE